jgi:hypothetical protein
MMEWEFAETDYFELVPIRFAPGPVTGALTLVGCGRGSPKPGPAPSPPSFSFTVEEDFYIKPPVDTFLMDMDEVPLLGERRSRPCDSPSCGLAC